MIPECQLYRQFAADGTLLYVGISTNAMARTGQHSKCPWASHVARIEIENFPDRAKAMKAEAWAVATECPLFNKRLQSDLTMSNIEVGKALKFTLEQAYAMARKGDLLHTIDPVEFEKMPRHERRHHRTVMNRLARAARIAPAATPS